MFYLVVECLLFVQFANLYFSRLKSGDLLGEEVTVAEMSNGINVPKQSPGGSLNVDGRSRRLRTLLLRNRADLLEVFLVGEELVDLGAPQPLRAVKVKRRVDPVLHDVGPQSFTT